MIDNERINPDTSADRAEAERVRARQAGIARMFAEGKDIGPAVFTLQKALLGGLMHAQGREARRLEADGKDKERIVAINARMERLAALGAELGEAETLAKRFAGNIAQPGMFHGYVRLASGAPAIGYAVRVSGVIGGRTKQVSGKTDDSGYFRIAVNARGEKEKSHDAGEKAAAASEPAFAVDILDPAERIVLADPAPPRFASDRGSVFRFYPLLGKQLSVDDRVKAAEANTAEVKAAEAPKPAEARTTRSTRPKR